jgi:hypothetical protein
MLKKSIIIAVAALLLLVPNVIRFSYFDNYMLGDTPYYHARMAETILENGPIEEDPVKREPYRFEAYHYLLAGVGFFTGVLTATNLLPYVVGILSVIFFVLLSDRIFGRSHYLMGALWIISPTFIYTFTVSNPFAVVLLLNLAGAYFLVLRRYAIGIVLLSLAPFFGLLNLMITLAIVLLAFYWQKDRKALTAVPFLCATGIVYTWLAGFEFTYSQAGLLTDNLVSLGATLGFNTFALMLAGLGFIVSWRREKKPVVLLLVIGLALLSLFVDQHYKIFLNIFVAVFAGMGMLKLLTMHWDLRVVRNLTILVLALALLSTTVGYIGRISVLEPTPQTIDALMWLRQSSSVGERVLSHPENEEWVEYFARRPFYTGDTNKTSMVFRSRDEQMVVNWLDENSITYVFVDDKTLQMMENENNQIGLLFIMENSNEFTPLYNSSGIIIWQT